ncbi:MAG: oligosaccharide flippase family protein [Candidatus Levybacteria bacterium]|nr:oligosaccharide flippase family protein [Candidatus Levybacteria bacterium]
MQEIDITTITKRSIHGVFALVSRTFLIQVVMQLVSFFLTIYLLPAEYGVFYIVSAAIAFLGYFSDIGLAAALIQKKEPLTKDDLRTTFTIQQGLVIVVSIIALLFSDQIGRFYSLDGSGKILYQALILAFFLSSLKTIPSILLERELKFQKLVIPEIVEAFAFSITVLTMVIMGFGVTSFTVAVVLRGFLGLITMYIVAPWKPEIGFSKPTAKRLLSFGLPFQANSILALLKDQLLVIYLGKALPLTQVGYIGVAQKLAYTPLRLFMDNIIRITFPSFSRLTGTDYLGKAIEKTLFGICVFIFPATAGMVLVMPDFIKVFPKYEKWEPVLVSLGFFAANAALSSISTPLTNALNAIGKIKVTLYLMIFWTLATWISIPICISLFGFNGVSIASFIISLSLFAVIFIAKRYISFSVLPVITPPLIATVVMSVFIYFLGRGLITSLPMLIIVMIVGGGVYGACLFIIAKSQILSDLALIKENLRK